MGRKTVFTGSGTALVTPFTGDGINYDALDQLLDFQLKGGSDAIIISGTTGECVTMSREERRELLAHAVKRVNGKVPVIAGTGTNETDKAIAMSQDAQEVGADALLVVTPYYNKTSQRGLVQYFSDIADSVDLPIIAYNVPSRTTVNILPATMAKIAEHKNMVGVKEACADISQIMDLVRLCPDLDLYSGNDDHVIPLMALGGKGVITTVGNIMPAKMHEMCAKFFSGDREGALKIQLEINPLVKVLFSDVNPIPVKTALRKMGYEVGPLRAPLCDMSPEGDALLESALRTYGLL